MIRAVAADSRAWLAKTVVCPALAHHQLRHLAVASVSDSIEIMRTKLGGSYFLACFDGEGLVLVDGRWMKFRPGHAVLFRPGTPQALHTSPGRTWNPCWVRSQERTDQRPLAAVQTPIVTRYDAEPLRLAILGLMPAERTMHDIPNRLGYWLRRVRKTPPQKRSPKPTPSSITCDVSTPSRPANRKHSASRSTRKPK